MEVFRSFKLFGLYFYVSSIRMRRRRSIDERMRSHRHVLLKKKQLLYKFQEGCCVVCGGHFGESELEIHHLVGVSENPGLALKTSNMVLVCHACHVKLHREKPSDEEKEG